MVYAYVALDVSNPEALSAYVEQAADALAKHGGALVAASREFTTLDGAPRTPDAGAILSFPSKDAATAWASDPALEKVHALRRQAGASDIVLLA